MRAAAKRIVRMRIGRSEGSAIIGPSGDPSRKPLVTRTGTIASLILVVAWSAQPTARPFDSAQDKPFDVAQGRLDRRVVEAAKARDLATLRTLIATRADVTVPHGDGATALHWAAHWDDAAIADVLIAAGAPVNAADDHGVTPLALACLNGSDTMV